MADKIAYVGIGTIQKFNKNEDGTVSFEASKATDSTLDLDEQIVDPTWAAGAMETWFSTGGNLREQHSSIAAGKALELDHRADGEFVSGLVVDPVSALKVENGVLSGLSIGIKRPRVIKDATAPGGRIIGGKIVEVSLVDRPANPSCKLVLAKSAGNGEIEFVEELTETPEENGDKTASGDTSVETTSDDADGTKAPSASFPEAEGGNTEGQSESDGAKPGQGDVATDRSEEPDNEDCGSCGQAHADGAAYCAYCGATLAVEADVTKRDFSAADRKRLAARGAAMSDGSFPIETKGDIENAIKLAGQAKNPAKAKAHIKRRAAALGASDMIPDDWKAALAIKAVTEPEVDELFKALKEKFADSEELKKLGEADDLNAARKAIANLILSEASEMVDGDDEIEDIACLLDALRLLRCFAWGEEGEGEIANAEEGDDTHVDVTMTVLADLVKAFTAEDPSDELTETRDELRKVLGLEDFTTDFESTKAATGETIKGLEDRLAKVEEMAAPSGPSRVRRPADSAKAARVDALTAEVLHCKSQAQEVHDIKMREGYMKRASKAQKELDQIISTMD